jgi:predicted AAA+ superfamily ATPase
MIRREASRLISAMAARYSLLTIAGPRCAGKSALARRLLPNHLYLDLESPDIMAYAKNSPGDFFWRYAGDIIINEFCRVPELFGHISGAAEKRQVVLLTSRRPSPRVRLGVTGGTAGTVTVLPPTIKDLCACNISLERDEYIHRGFMPCAYRENVDPRKAHLSYLAALLQRDIAPLVRTAEHRTAFTRFFRLLAERVGLALNIGTFASTVGVSQKLLALWMRALEAHFVLFRLPVYPDCFSRAESINAPKFYFTDVGLAAYLLKIQEPGQVIRHPAVGNLFENLVVAEALKAACNQGREANMFYYRNRDGFEIDLVLPSGGDIVPVEIKSSAAFNASFADNIRRFRSFAENIQDGYVVYSGAGNNRVKGVRYVNFREIADIVRELRV